MDFITNLLSSALSAYAVTFVIASSSIMEPFRKWFMSRTPMLKIGNHKHFIECRMCCGFWVSFIVCLFYGNILDVVVVYGASYFLATQERN